MSGSSKMSEELLVHRKNSSRNHKTGNGGLIINNGRNITPVLIKPDKSKTMAASAMVPARKVPVLYYLSRNGHLEHPHLINVPLSSPHGLYLSDVINTLNYQRGKGMASMYSWSFKRSYKSGYVWHDASEDDLIQPTNAHDYVLKGSELLQTNAPLDQSDTYHTDDNCSSTTTAAPAKVVRRNQSWSSFDNPQEHFVVKCESNRELAMKFAPDALTQTEEHVTVELSTGEMPSPPPSNSSSEISEVGNGSRYIDQTVKERDRVQTIEDQYGSSGLIKASQVLMQLITCGADSVRHASPVKSQQARRCTVTVEHGKSLGSAAHDQESVDEKTYITVGSC